MQIEIIFRNLTPSDPLKNYALKRFQKLDRLAGGSEEDKLLVTLSMESGRPRVDVLLSAQEDIAATEKNDDVYAAIDLCTDRLGQQLRKASERRSQINRDTIVNALDDAR